MTNARTAIGWRTINASICAYQIHVKGWTPGPGPQPPVLRRIEGPGGAYFYTVVPDYQDRAGFVGSAESGYAPLFVATGSDRINAESCQQRPPRVDQGLGAGRRHPADTVVDP